IFSSMKVPVVSIIMPVFNVEPYISDAINSILNQSFKEFELIIVNDASTDHTEKIINGIKDKRIVYIRNQENVKIVESLNTGLDIVQGEFIARMDGDDLSLPERLEKQVNFLNRNPDVGVCGTWLEKFGVINKVVKAVEKPEEIIFGMSLNNVLPHATMLARTDLFR